MSDLISRQAAIDALKAHEDYKGYLHGDFEEILEALPSVHPEPLTLRVNRELAKEEYDKLMRDIKNAPIILLPSVQPEQKWIPCSERLPDMHDEVLVTARGEVSIAWLYVDGKWRSNDMPQPMLRDIIAWMPLPEPYKGEQE